MKNVDGVDQHERRSGGRDPSMCLVLRRSRCALWALDKG
jgi:hypothetical protein